MNETPYNLLKNKYDEISDYLLPVKDKYPKIVNDMLYYYVIENIDLFSEIEDSLGSEGVYFIEDFYIGRTHNIISRLSAHIIEIFEPQKGSNQEKKLKIENILKYRKLKTVIISNNKNDEKELIIQYSSKYNLANIRFNIKNIK